MHIFFLQSAARGEKDRLRKVVAEIQAELLYNQELAVWKQAKKQVMRNQCTAFVMRLPHEGMFL